MKQILPAENKPNENKGVEKGNLMNNSSANVAGYSEESKTIAGGEQGEGRNENRQAKT